MAKHMKTLSPIYKTLRMRKNVELLFTSECLMLFRKLALPFKAGVSRARVNHSRGLELVQPQELSRCFFPLLYKLVVAVFFIASPYAVSAESL